MASERTERVRRVARKLLDEADNQVESGEGGLIAA